MHVALLTKFLKFNNFLYCENYDMLFITETWLCPEISSGLLDPHSCYYILRKDRCTSVGGGVAAFVNRRLVFSEVQVDKEFADVELLCFDTVVCTKSKVRFFVVYCPPCLRQFRKHYNITWNC